MQQGIPTPPPPPTFVGPSAGQVVTTRQLNSDPTAIWRAAKEQRSELQNQLEELQSTRRHLSEQLNSEGTTNLVDRKGIEQHMAEVDQRISAVDKQLAQADAQVAAAAAVPGAVQEPVPVHRDGPPDEVYVLASIFLVVCILPISVAFARRLWKRGITTVAALPQELMERMSHLDQAVESIAIEVERIGEGQRFVTRLFSEQQNKRAAIGAVPEER